MQSVSVRKGLDKWIKENYAGVTMNWSKTNEKVSVEKGKKFVQANFSQAAADTDVQDENSM